MSTATLTRTATAAPVAPAPAPAWQAVTVANQRGPWVRKGSAADWTVYALDGPGRVRAAGELWRNRAGEWFAHRTGHGMTTVGHATRADALASVGWLDTVTADALADRLAQDGRGVRVVLSDGSAALVYAAQSVELLTGTGTGEPVRRPGVELSAIVEGPAAGTIAHRWPVAADAVSVRPWALVDTIAGTRTPAYRITLRASARVALVPPCQECDAPAGTPCAFECAAAAI